MSNIHVSVSRVIDAPADVIYGILSDYRAGHPSILPKPYFKELVVEEGGVGEGTVARVGMEVMGSQQTLRLRVTEPEPGRVLREEDAAAGVVTLGGAGVSGTPIAVYVATASRRDSLPPPFVASTE